MDNLLGQGSSVSITQPKEETSEDNMQCPICQEKSRTLTCSACKSVAYCCVDHQKLDWKNHKKVCQPFIIKETKDMGKGWIATRNLKAGVVLLEEFPVIQAPAWRDITQFEIPHCLTCAAKMDNMRTCSACSWPVCSDQCEKAPIHKDNECKELAHRKLKYPPPPFWPVGMLVMCIRGKALKARDPPTFKQLMTLQDFSHIPVANDKLHFLLGRLPLGMFQLLSEPDSLDLDEYQKLLRISLINCLKSSEHGLKGDNFPIYLKGSRINHSCFANCTASFSTPENIKLQVRTVLPVNKGDQLTINFFGSPDFIFQSTSFRQKEFKLSGFVCKCKRCRDPSEMGTFLTGIKCFNCSSELTPNSDSVGFFLPANPLDTDSPDPELKCHRCRAKCPTSQVMATLPNGLRAVLADILMLTCAVPVDCKALDAVLTKYEKDPVVNGHLHKNYWTVLGATRMLMKLQLDHLDKMTKEELERLVRRIEYHLTIAEKFYPGSGFHAKFKDLKMLAKVVELLYSKFFAGCPMTHKALNLRRILNQTSIGQLEFLIIQGKDEASPEEKLKIATHLKILKEQGVLYAPALEIISPR